MRHLKSLAMILLATSLCSNSVAANSDSIGSSDAEASGLASVKALVASTFPKEVFDLVYYPAGSKPDKVAKQINRLIKLADKRSMFIVIGSEDPMNQVQIAKQVFRKFPNKLTGSRIAMIGSQVDRTQLESIVAATGATFLFVEMKSISGSVP